MNSDPLLSEAPETPSGIQKILREHESFIPLRHRELIQQLLLWIKPPDSQIQCWHQLCNGLVSIFHVEHLANLLRVEDLYEPFDPDSEALTTPHLAEQRSSVAVERLLDRLSCVLFTAHYHQLSTDDLKEAVRLGSEWGIQLQINFDIFQDLLVFARGYRNVKSQRRRWQDFFRLREIEFPEFHRLVLIFRLKPNAESRTGLKSEVVHLKIFKNIPENELEVLLPGSRVKLSLLDQGKILIPTLSSAALVVTKIMRGLMIVTFFAVSAWLNRLLCVGLLAFYLIRGVLNYFRTRDQYQFGLTRNLYLKNLDNNAGVIYRIFNEAEEQEVCETLLVYGVLHQAAKPLTDGEIRDATCAVLTRFSGRKVRLDIDDALGKLSRCQLAAVDASGLWQVVPVEEAADMLADYWQKQFRKGSSLLNLNAIFHGVAESENPNGGGPTHSV